MKYIRIVEGRIAGRPFADSRPEPELRRLGFVPVVSDAPDLGLACAECFEALFIGLDYDPTAQRVTQRILSITEIKARFAEWLLNVLSARQIAQTIKRGDQDWQLQLTLPVYHDLLTGVITQTPTVVLATRAGLHELLTLTYPQAQELIAGYRRDYAQAAHIVMAIHEAVKSAITLDELLELTATLDARLPWVAFTRAE